MDIYEKIGESALLQQIAEEAAELAQAALKLARKIDGKNPTPKSMEECIASLLEEFADTDLAMDSWLLHQRWEYRNRIDQIEETKKKRWEERINGNGK